MTNDVLPGKATATNIGMLKAILVLVLSLATVAVVTSGAVFTDSQAVGGNAFTTGTVDLSASPASAAVSFDGMMPGDSVTAPITVNNDGTVQYRYAVTSTATNADSKDLAAQLDMTIKSAVTDCTSGGFAADGTVLYGPAALGDTTGIDVIGDPSQGGQAGDRTLSAAASEELCFRVSLPSSTGPAFEGATTTATFTFNAEQVASNP
jgi:Camelysin metallo-endopeptidase